MKIILTKEEMRMAALEQLRNVHPNLEDVNYNSGYIDDRMLDIVANNGNKIYAIKLLRLMCPSMGLTEAKNEIEKRYPNCKVTV